MADTPTPPVKSAGRALEIIEHLAEHGAKSFAQILDELALPRSSAHGLLRTLESSGWVELHPTLRTYSLGLRAWQIGQQYDGHRALVAVADDEMIALSRDTGETVQLARLDGVENVYIAIALSPNPMRMASRVGMRLHAHATGIGKSLLGTLTDDEIRRRLHDLTLPRLTERTVTDVDELIAVINQGRLRGYTVDDEEFVAGCRCIAMPVTTPEETGIATALSITMPSSRTDAHWPHSLFEPLHRTVSSIREQLGLTAR